MPSKAKSAKKSAASHKSASQASSSKATTSNMPKDEELPPPIPVSSESKEKSVDDKPKERDVNKTKASKGRDAHKSKASKKDTDTKDVSEVLKNAFPGIFPAILSDDSSNEKDADSDADIFSTKPLESEDETTSELIQRGKEIKKTLQYVNAFLDSTKDKHFFEVPITPLKGRENWDSWVAAVEVVLRMQQVWVLFVEEIVPLDKQHEMYVWYDRMLDVGMAVILKNVAAPIREHPCFIRSLVQRDPAGMMGHLWAHYGDVDGDDSESELYSE